MTDKQKDYIISLDNRCKSKGIPTRSTNEDLLGADWLDHYKNFTPEYTGEVIDKLRFALGLPVSDMSARRKKK